MLKIKDEDYTGKRAECGFTRPYYLQMEDIYLEGGNITFHKGNVWYKNSVKEFHKIYGMGWGNRPDFDIFIHDHLKINDMSFVLDFKMYKDKMEYVPSKNIEKK